MEEEGVLEVRCAGCGDTLEVERGLTEFACPSCATPHALPPELMSPPPPRPRRALPLGLAAAPARVPCGGCGAVLAVPRWISRPLACPLCGVEIDVDGGGRLAAYSGVQVISPPGAVALAATSSRLLEEQPRLRVSQAPSQKVFIPRRSSRIVATSGTRSAKPEAQARKILMKKLGLRSEEDERNPTLFEEFQEALAQPLTPRRKLP